MSQPPCPPALGRRHGPWPRRHHLGARAPLAFGLVLLLSAACSDGGDNDDDTSGASADDIGEVGDTGAIGGEDAGAAEDTAASIPDGAVCAPGTTGACVSAVQIEVCAADGSAFVAETCKSETGATVPCIEGACAVCDPGAKRCAPADNTIVEQCSSAGSWEQLEVCDVADGRECFDGLCARACEQNLKANSYIGCGYWATDLDNAFVPGGSRGYYDAAGAQYAVVVSNPSATLTTTVSIKKLEGGEVVPVEYDAKGELMDFSPLAPGELRVFNLPPRNINGTVIAPLAYKVESSAPITAYQFNPLENVNVFSNDASILLPDELLGKYYYVMSREQSFGVLRGFVTIVAAAQGTTTVNVTFSKTTRKTLASADGGQSIKVYNGGDSAQFLLSQWDVLNLETDEVGSDLTGSVVVADKRVAVFGGSEAANAPNTNRCDTATCTEQQINKGESCGVCAFDGETKCFKNEQCQQFITCCADHLEMQMFPVTTWGSHYVAVKLMPRNKEQDYWRIIAAEDGTKVTTVPPIPGEYVPVLDAGEWYEIETDRSFEIIAKKANGDPAPIMVGHFMASQDAPDPNLGQPQPGDAGTGDPAFLLAIPTAQWREDFVFLVPEKYSKNFISIAAPLDADVQLDGSPLAPDFFEKVSGKYKMTRLFVEPGPHSVTASAPVAVDVYGFDQYVSYGYPAGLDLEDLKLVEEPAQ